MLFLTATLFTPPAARLDAGNCTRHHEARSSRSAHAARRAPRRSGRTRREGGIGEPKCWRGAWRRRSAPSVASARRATAADCFLRRRCRRCRRCPTDAAAVGAARVRRRRRLVRANLPLPPMPSLLPPPSAPGEVAGAADSDPRRRCRRRLQELATLVANDPLFGTALTAKAAARRLGAFALAVPRRRDRAARRPKARRRTSRGQRRQPARAKRCVLPRRTSRVLHLGRALRLAGPRQAPRRRRVQGAQGRGARAKEALRPVRAARADLHQARPGALDPHRPHPRGVRARAAPAAGRRAALPHRRGARGAARRQLGVRDTRRSSTRCRAPRRVGVDRAGVQGHAQGRAARRSRSRCSGRASSPRSRSTSTCSGCSRRSRPTSRTRSTACAPRRRTSTSRSSSSTSGGAASSPRPTTGSRRRTRRTLARRCARAASTPVCAPAVVEELVRDTVLVTEWVDGTRLDRDASPDVPRLCGVAINAYLTMLLDTGVLHCDPHPGNLLRTTDGKLCILDWGMTLAVPRRPAVLAPRVHRPPQRRGLRRGAAGLCEHGLLARGRLRRPAQGSGITDGLSFAFRQLSAGGGPKKIAERVEVELKERYGTELSGRELEKKAQEEIMARWRRSSPLRAST